MKVVETSVVCVKDVLANPDPNVWLEHARPVITERARQFARRYRQEPEDMVADALSIYLTHMMDPVQLARAKPGQKFDNYVQNWTWFQLFDEYRTRDGVRRRHMKPKADSDCVALVADHRMARFSLGEFYEGLSADAEIAAWLALTEDSSVAGVAVARGNQPRNWRSALREYLLGVGWPPQRVQAAFAELAGAV